MDVLLIDDHPLFRAGISSILDGLDATVRIIEAGSCEQALILLEADGEFSLILLDLHLPGMDGMTGLAKLRDASPATPVVVLSATEDSRRIRQAIAAGAKGYIPKSASSQIILSALRLVLSGGVYLPHNVLESPAPVVTDGELTPRQREVLRWLARGKSNKEIADVLGMAENTVRVHVAAILKYLDVRNRAEAVFAAISRRLVEAEPQ
jgi:DNA-binding NarL/FixJ family response regulator